MDEEESRALDSAAEAAIADAENMAAREVRESMNIQRHRDKEVQAAIVHLADALCTWERNTGIESMMIIREQEGFVFRAASGKADIPNDISDELLLKRFQS